MTIRILNGDCRQVLQRLPEKSVQTCVTSPPYFGLRDYGVAGQIGLEPTPDDFVSAMVEVFREVRRVLRDDGTLWLNLGDSYTPVNRGENARPRRETMTGMQVGNPHADITTRKEVISGVKSMGLKSKDLMGIPWRVAFALQADGWYLRSDIIWHKPNPMPESVTDRPTSAHEHIFLMSKSERYFYDFDAVREPVADASLTRLAQNVDAQAGSDRAHAGAKTNGTMKAVGSVDGRNLRNVWTVATQPYSGAHFATFPPALIEPCIKAGSAKGDTVLDPFGGAGTTGMVADRLGRDAVLVELNPAYAAMAEARLSTDAGMFASVALEAAE